MKRRHLTDFQVAELWHVLDPKERALSKHRQIVGAQLGAVRPRGLESPGLHRLSLLGAMQAGCAAGFFDTVNLAANSLVFSHEMNLISGRFNSARGSLSFLHYGLAKILL